MICTNLDHVQNLTIYNIFFKTPSMIQKERKKHFFREHQKQTNNISLSECLPNI